jgi:DNA-binding transcriptional LysR family regulator
MPSPDLNLLRVFDVLLEERSVTRAGARLGLTQSAVSHSLARLRHMLNDELFVRGPMGMHPTPRALEVGARLHGPMAQLQAVLGPAAFDPATTERRFTIAAGAYAAAVLAPPLIGRLAALAPHAALVVNSYGPDLLDQLDTRTSDFAIAGVISAPPRFAHATLIAEELVWALGPGSPMAGRSAVTLADIASIPHVVVAAKAAGEEMARRGLVTRASWDDAGALDAALASRGLTRRVAATVPDTPTALAVASRSGLATLAPRRFAGAWGAAGFLKLFDLPYDAPPVDIRLMYLRDRLREPAIGWMLRLIEEVAQSL